MKDYMDGADMDVNTERPESTESPETGTFHVILNSMLLIRLLRGNILRIFRFDRRDFTTYWQQNPKELQSFVEKMFKEASVPSNLLAQPKLKYPLEADYSFKYWMEMREATVALINRCLWALFSTWNPILEQAANQVKPDFQKTLEGWFVPETPDSSPQAQRSSTVVVPETPPLPEDRGLIRERSGRGDENTPTRPRISTSFI